MTGKEPYSKVLLTVEVFALRSDFGDGNDVDAEGVEVFFEARLRGNVAAREQALAFLEGAPRRAREVGVLRASGRAE